MTIDRERMRRAAPCFVVCALLSMPARTAERETPARSETPAPVSAVGRVEELTISSRVYRRDRRIWVYTPPGYESSSAVCDLLVVFDGGVYLEQIPLPRILDDLHARKKAGPYVAILIDNASSAERLADLANHVRFAEFVGGELVDWARRRWRVTHDPHRTIVTGSSAGGLAAAFVAFQRPDVFGNVLSQSGAFWRGNEGTNGGPYEWLTSQYAAAPKRDVRFVLEVGSRESGGAMGGAAPSILDANRRLRDTLLAKGYSVTYDEVPRGEHAPESWRERLPAAIAALSRR